MYRTMKSSSGLIVTSVVAMVVVVSYVYVQYSGPVSNQANPTIQQEAEMWKEIQRQQLQIEQLNQKMNRLHSELFTQQRSQPIKKQSQLSASEQKQSQLSASEEKQSQPSASEQKQSQPSASEQKQSQPSASEQKQSQPSASEQKQSQPSASEQKQSQPSASEHKQSQSSASEQKQSQSSASEQKQSQSSASEQKQSQPSASEHKQRQLFDNYNKMPVNVYSYRDKSWTRVPKLCQNLANFRSTKLHTLSGVLDIYIHDPKKDIWVSGALANGQIWESGFVNLILNSLKKEKDAAFVDIGANLGVYSLFAAKQGVNVISIEPLIVNVQRMCTSIRAGHLGDKMTIVRGALSDVSENVTLGIDVNNVGGSFVIQSQNENKVKASHVGGQYSDVVMSATLDDLLNLPDFNFSRVVMKMDVEGYEHKVMRGGTEFFDRVAVPTILMEWEFHKGAESGKEIIKFFESRNYTAYEPMRNTFLESEFSKSWPHEIVWRKKV